MENLFDGQDGRSDGTVDGFSVEFEVKGAFNVHCFGTFGGGSVTLQRFSPTLGDFANTDAVWNADAQFQALYITPHSKYRLNITGSTGASIIAERA